MTHDCLETDAPERKFLATLDLGNGQIFLPLSVRKTYVTAPMYNWKRKDNDRDAGYASAIIIERSNSKCDSCI